jgi:hypothetical protein
LLKRDAPQQESVSLAKQSARKRARLNRG